MPETERDCIAALREAADRLGESPTKAAYEELGLTPASATIQRVMGGWNAAKDAADLETASSTGSRTHSKPDDVDIPDDVTWNELSVYQRWHYKNRDWNTERTLRRRRRLRDWLDSIREQNGCSRCDATDPRTIDFHHPDPEAKERAVTEMVTHGYSRADIQAEVDRCIMLCANCHAKEHRAVSIPDEPVEKGERLRAWAIAYKREQGCGRCPESNPASLEFHHPGEKRDGVGRLIAHSAPESVVRTEVDRCEVVCANCHRLEHHPKEAPESDRS